MQKHIRRGEKGISLIEVLVSIALISSIGCAVLASLTSASKATGITDERTMAESLAQAQLEDIMRAEFDDVNNPPVYDQISCPDTNYNIVISPQHITFGNHTATTAATGLQKITIDIYHGGDLVSTTEALKGRYG